MDQDNDGYICSSGFVVLTATHDAPTLLPVPHRSKVDQIQEIVTGNPTVIKMVVSFNRGARGQNALRQILAPAVKDIMDDKALNIKTDPVDIYKSWVNQMETQTGEAR